ncbi:UDP-4-amino-4,6-dideoxy-N-acetyl-beta-L-altrosamine N-acetyltransferase [Sphingopyxis sp.]|uniref:UDP-4-amino-4, 6-dideoxy-N-acetyl-beta-L-altrosamine N-acetyltransferase n=1 Tax=Sphingopyxis sp. TaxID=1908224 RepID=UPI002EDAC4EA
MASPHEKTAGGRLRPVGEEDLRELLSWRNHPDVRRFMFTSREIEWEEHCRWFTRCLAEPGRHLLIYEAGGVDLGFVNLSGVHAGGIAEWGFFLVPGAPRGSGMRLGAATLDHVFGERHAHKLCGQAIANNDRSIAFHQRLGFRQEGVLRDQHFDGANYLDVICFGLLAQELSAAAKEEDDL